MNQSNNDILAYVWGSYREYAMTSRKIKATIKKIRVWVIVLTILGAISGTASMQLADGVQESLCQILGFLSAISIGVAAYLGKEIISPEREKKWVIARSAAEALKSEAYLYATSTTPYNTPEADDTFLDRAKNIRENSENVRLVNISAEEKKKRLIQKPLSFDKYLEKRVKEQIEDYYKPAAHDNNILQKKWNLGKHTFGIIGIALGAIGGFGYSGLTAGWVAVIGTITTAITAYLFAERYNYLSLSYQKTAQILEDHLAQWMISDKTDQDKAELIIACESTISMENRAWMVELSKKSKSIIPDSLKNKSMADESGIDE